MRILGARAGMQADARRRLAALGALVAAAVVLLAPASPAAAAPFVGAQATALGGSPLIQANCPTAVSPPVQVGPSTSGVLTVSGPAGALCNGANPIARTSGQYTLPSLAQQGFDASCDGTTGATGGGVFVSAGTTGLPGGTTTAVTAVQGPAIVTSPTAQSPFSTRSSPRAHRSLAGPSASLRAQGRVPSSAR